MTAAFETGPIRPPSEARSLLVRVGRNCPWNRCTFCPVYKGRRFSKRPVEEVLADLDGMRAVLERISPALPGADGRQGRKLVHQYRKKTGGLEEDLRTLGPWIHDGQRTAFLQDADPLVASVEDLVAILQRIERLFPSIERITAYARCQTLMHKSPSQLRALRDAGLSRIHMGMESGADRVLSLVKKGATAQRLREAGRRVKASGLSLCLYVMPGLGGKVLTEEHGRETGRVVAHIDPDHVRLRSTAVIPGTPLAALLEAGDFTPLSEVETVREIRSFLQQLEGATCAVVSDHVLNLLQELEGQLPQDLPRLLAITERFLALPDEEQRLFIVGRRLGYVRSLDHLKNDGIRSALEPVVKDLAGSSQEDFEAALRRIMAGFV